jgi:hypothetical protein
MDRAELEHLLEQVNAEKATMQNQVAALQARLTALMKAADGIQALLEMTPAQPDLVLKADSDAGHVADAAVVREVERVVPLPQSSRVEVPKGKKAARLILESDQSKFWTVRQVWNEQVRRGWAEPRPRGRKGNPPSRIALMRLQEDYPANVEVIDAPVLAYRWTSGSSSSPNGSGVSHAEEAEEEL